MANLKGDSATAGDPGVLGENTAEGGAGVYGRANANGAGGVIGHADKGRGVYGESPSGTGVWGWSNAAGGVVGESMLGEGIRGVSHGAHGAVVGVNDSSAPSAGEGVYAESKNGEGVRGISHSANHGGVVGTNDNSAGVGIYGKGGRLAGLFEGKVEITESLIVQGIDVVGLLHRLQQLEPILAELEAARAARSIISVQQVSQAQGGGARFMITGEHFRAFATVQINVHSNTSAGAMRVGNTDGQGKLNTFLEIPCFPGTVLSITAFDEITQQTSNTETITCT